jgi:hypothetical protein
MTLLARLTSTMLMAQGILLSPGLFEPCFYGCEHKLVDSAISVSYVQLCPQRLFLERIHLRHLGDLVP